jgi:hypothetical protein
MANERIDQETRARRRTEDVWAFWVHALLFLAVNAWVWAMDITSGGGVEWAYWTTIPWAIGLALHGATVIAELRVFGEEWRERKFEDYLERERRPRP